MEKSLNPKQVLTETGVYCVWDENNRFAKIGFSCELSRRLEDLQHAHGEELRLICWFDAGNQKEAYDTEYRLHSRLKHCRGRGEHFLVADPMMTDFLQTLGGIKYLSCRDANAAIAGSKPGKTQRTGNVSAPDCAAHRRRGGVEFRGGFYGCSS